MKKVFIVMPALLTFFYGAAQNKGKATTRQAAPKGIFKNLLDSFSYAAGYNVATNMKAQKINKLNTTIMQRAIDDVYKGKQLLLTTEQINASLQNQMQAFTKSAASTEIEKGVAFLNANKKRKEVITLPSGLQYEVLKKSDTGTIKPRAIDTVVVNYVGTLIDGKEFENSYKRGQPAIFQMMGVIRGWTEILQLMTVGDKWKVYIPTEMAYNLNPRNPELTPPGAALIFEITLEGIKPAITITQ